MGVGRLFSFALIRQRRSYLQSAVNFTGNQIGRPWVGLQRFDPALHEKSSLFSVGFLLRRSNMFIAPNLQIHPAPLGAECNLHRSNNMALRWSAGGFDV